jgi:hypothetical protein
MTAALASYANGRHVQLARLWSLQLEKKFQMIASLILSDSKDSKFHATLRTVYLVLGCQLKPTVPIVGRLPDFLTVQRQARHIV